VIHVEGAGPDWEGVLWSDAGTPPFCPYHNLPWVPRLPPSCLTCCRWRGQAPAPVAWIAHHPPGCWRWTFRLMRGSTAEVAHSRNPTWAIQTSWRLANALHPCPHTVHLTLNSRIIQWRQHPGLKGQVHLQNSLGVWISIPNKQVPWNSPSLHLYKAEWTISSPSRWNHWS